MQATSPSAFDELETAVHALEEGSPVAPPARTVHALEELAASLDALPEPHGDWPSRIRDTAHQLETSSGSAQSRTALVKQALSSALEALIARTPPHGNEISYTRATRTLGHVLEEVDASRPLRDERPTVVAAFHAAANAVFIARGAEPPFQRGTQASEGQTGAAPRSAADAVGAAHDDILELAQAKWTDERKSVARVLDDFADFVQAADCRGALGEKIALIRFERERLRRSDTFGFEQAGWVKDGLSKTLDAVGALRLGKGAPSSHWLSNARKAVNGIDTHASVTFQRPAIQDAFRATVDALTALVPFVKPCSRPT